MPTPQQPKPLRIRIVEAQYIESGTFQGGEEDVSMAGIKYDQTCVVMSRHSYKILREWEKVLIAALKAARAADSGTLRADDPSDTEMPEEYKTK